MRPAQEADQRPGACHDLRPVRWRRPPAEDDQPQRRGHHVRLQQGRQCHFGDRDASAGGGSARTTSFTYDNAQQLKTATLPDGVVLTYAYDAAHRLTSVTDNVGNKVAYAYDLKDNRTQTVVKDSGGTIQPPIDAPSTRATSFSRR